VAEQVAIAPEPERVQGEPVNAPVPLVVNITLPAGIVAVPAPSSVMVAVQVVGEPVSMLDGRHVMLVVVERLLIVMLTDAIVVLVLCTASPL